MNQMELVQKNIKPEILNSMKLKIHFGWEDIISKLKEKSIKISSKTLRGGEEKGNEQNKKDKT